MANKSAQKDDRDKQHAAPLAEWVVGAIGLVLVATAITVLTYEAMKGEASPPAVTVSVLGIGPQPGGYLVEVRATNEGGTTAGELTIEGSLSSGGREVEKSEATIDYVPSHSNRKAGLFFTHNPQDFELQVRPSGYREP
ncbi:MAG: hypothetical protein H0W33_03025 [Gammaproteobacteria bacterium]|nr:hypothetical protein [Gammaproteobacteria bacterium]